MTRPPAFAAVLAELREGHAAAAFSKAVHASRLRHAAVAQGRRRSAAALAGLKLKQLKRAAELSARLVVRSATDDPTRMLSVRLGRKSLHVPRVQWGDADSPHRPSAGGF